jgi:hypothetical protein
VIEGSENPKLIALLRVGSVIFGECSVCHHKIVVTGVPLDTEADGVHLIREAFDNHVQEQHPTLDFPPS